jgi:3-oxoacyl-[acyl-carrier protein] reductase
MTATTGRPAAFLRVVGIAVPGVPWHCAVQVLAQELADRGVTVNTILPTAIDGAGVFTDADPSHPVRELIASQPGRIGRRMGTVDDVADAAENLSSDLARWVSGQSLLVSGGATQ